MPLDGWDPAQNVESDVRRRHVAYAIALVAGGSASALLIVYGEVQTPELTVLRGVLAVTTLALAAGLLARRLSLRTLERSLLALVTAASVMLVVRWGLDPAPGDATLPWLAVLFPLAVLVLGKSSGLKLNLAVYTLLAALAAGALITRALGLEAAPVSHGAIINYLGLHGAIIALLFALGGRYEALIAAHHHALVRERDANTDQLTGVANRRRLTAALLDAVETAHASGRPLSVAWCDLDHFKHINDTFGHDAGDRVLTEAVARLEAVTRGGDLMGRWGGEELLVMLPDCDHQDALAVAELCRGALGDEPFEGLGAITVSVGVATLGPDEERDALLKRADRHLYEAKAAGRDCVVGEHGPVPRDPGHSGPDRPRRGPAPTTRDDP